MMGENLTLHEAVMFLLMREHMRDGLTQPEAQRYIKGLLEGLGWKWQVPATKEDAINCLLLERDESK